MQTETNPLGPTLGHVGTAALGCPSVRSTPASPLPPELQAPELHPEELFEIHAVGLTTRKRRGETAEAVFLAKASGLGFGVAKPWGDSERYDFLLDSGHNLWRVQVKSTQRYAESRYRVKAAGWKATYTRHEIDFIVVYLIPEDLWYVVPIAAVASRKGLRFYPHGGRNSRFEKYREAWCLMASPRPAGTKDKEDEDNGSSQMPVSCRCPQIPVRCAVCPLRT